MTLVLQTQRCAQLAVDCRCTLGEGILWCPRRGVLLWTDIERARLWMHRPGAAATQARHWSLPDRLGSLALCQSGQLLLGLAKGLYVVDFDMDAAAPAVPTLVAPVEPNEPRTRINDGRCDRAGNFVFGTLNEQAARAPIGSFYQYSFRHGLRRLKLGGVAIPNSLCFSPDGSTLYYCDTMQLRILACDYDPESAAVANSRVFAVSREGTCPDGSTVDAEGHVWNAQWGGSQVVRYTPEGTIDRIVQVAARNPTCATFGGAALDELYITTAREDLSDEDLACLPESGGVYRAQPGVRGLAEHEVRLQ